MRLKRGEASRLELWRRMEGLRQAKDLVGIMTVRGQWFGLAYVKIE